MSSLKPSDWMSKQALANGITFVVLLFFAEPCNGGLVAEPLAVLIGGVVNLTCTNLTKECPGGRSWIVRNNETLDGSESKRVGDNLFFQHVPYDKKLGCYVCLCNKGLKVYPTGVVFVQTGSPPAPAVNITCQSPDWEELTCSWDYQRSGSLVTKWNVTYSAFSLRTGKSVSSMKEELLNRTCPIEKSNPTTCRIDAGNLLRYKQYELTIQGSNDLGVSTQIIKVITDPSIVKPAAIDNVTVLSTTDSSATLQWNVGGQSPMNSLISSKGLQYKVSFGPRASALSLPKVKRFSSTNSSVSAVLIQLEPFLEYTICIKCRVNVKGSFWSETVSLIVKTKEAAPESKPVVNRNNGFSYSDNVDCGYNGQALTLYWQGIPPMSRHGNGVISDYTIRSMMTADVKHVSGTARQISFCLNATGSHLYHVSGGTHAGHSSVYSEIHATSSAIAAGIRLNACDISAEVTANAVVEVSVHQRAVSQAGANLTESIGNSIAQEFIMFWCKADGRSECKTDIQWMHLEAKMDRKNMSVVQPLLFHPLQLAGDMDGYQFGISRAISGSSSGITWADCLHSVTGQSIKVQAPEVFRTVHGALSIKLKQVSCLSGKSRIVTRKLNWCNVDSYLACVLNESSVMALCCLSDSHQVLEVGLCDHESTIAYQENQRHAIWVSHKYSNGDLLHSNVLVVNSSSQVPNGFQLSDTMVGGIAFGCALILCISIVATIALKTYLRFSTKIEKILKVPAIREDESSSNEGGFYKLGDSMDLIYGTPLLKTKELAVVDSGLGSSQSNCADGAAQQLLSESSWPECDNADYNSSNGHRCRSICNVGTASVDSILYLARVGEIHEESKGLVVSMASIRKPWSSSDMLTLKKSALNSTTARKGQLEVAGNVDMKPLPSACCASLRRDVAHSQNRDVRNHNPQVPARMSCSSSDSSLEYVRCIETVLKKTTNTSLSPNIPEPMSRLSDLDFLISMQPETSAANVEMPSNAMPPECYSGWTQADGNSIIHNAKNLASLEYV